MPLKKTSNNARTLRSRGTGPLLLALLACCVLSSSALHAQVDLGRLTTPVQEAVELAMVEGRIPSMTIAIVSNKRVLWSQGFGYSNLWARTPAVPTTVYLIGSTFKAQSMWTLLKQMDQGRCTLDDSVNNYLREVQIQGESPDLPVTFRHLLTHTSGLKADFGPHLVWGNSVPRPLEEYLQNSLELTHPTMSKVVYSNTAYTLIGYLVEKMTGEDFREVVQKQIWDVLKMSDTAFFPRPDMEERLAIPYVVHEYTKGIVPTDRYKADVWPAGIVYGTVLNQANWLIANLNHGAFEGTRLISEAAFQETMRRQFDQFAGPISEGWLNETTGFGLTWWISEKDGEKLFAHSGSVPGYTAFLVGNLDRGEGVAMLSNGNRAHAHLFRLANKILDLLKATVDDPVQTGH